MKYLFAISFLSLLLFSQCTESLKNRVSRNQNVIADDTLVQVLVDMALMDSYLKKSAMVPKEKSKQAVQLYLGVLAQNKITKSRLDSTFMFYRDHFEEFKIIFDSAKNQLDRMEVEGELELDSLQLEQN